MTRNQTKLAILLLFFCLSSLVFPIHRVTVRADAEKPTADFGISGLEQELRKLSTTARMIHTTAHPDDEDGGMLAFESRGMGAAVTLLTLNRGEGGQNKTGSELFDALGILRTLELLAADDYYGVSERFTRVADFGFSKNADETFTQWKGHDIPLGDMVRVIRTFRPDVLVSRFQGAPRDGHGHHQAAGVLTKEAFRAAGDPSRFPEQIKEGLLPWQPKKLYEDNVKPGEDYSVQIDTGTYDPSLGASYIQFALEGLSHQLSQGSGGVRVSPGHHYSYYKLLESTVQTPGSNGGHEQSFFDGIDTSLPGLMNRLSSEGQKTVPFLASGLTDLQGLISQARAAFTPDNPARAASPLLAGLKLVNDLIGQIEPAPLTPDDKLDLLTELRTKRDQFERASNLALGVELDVYVDSPAPKESEPVGFPSPKQTFAVAVPGQTFTLTAHFYNRSSRPITVQDISLDMPPGWKSETIKGDLKSLGTDDTAEVQFRVTVPEDAAYTRPYWHRDDTQQTVYQIDQPQYITLPFPPYPVHAIAKYSLAGADGQVSSVAKVRYIDPLYGQGDRPLAVGPPVSISLQPETRVISAGKSVDEDLLVGVRNDATGEVKGTLHLNLPPGWKSEPETADLNFSHEGELTGVNFKVRSAASKEGRFKLSAVASISGKDYSEGFQIVTRHDLGSFYYYHPASEDVSAVSVKTPEALKIGYVMGAGDEIPQILRQIGMSVTLITPAELASGDLSQFGTIILGIRAYDVRTDVRDYNKRLLEFVSNGGTLVVQYNQSTQVFNSGNYAPYPLTASAKRVTVEEAPVNILKPEDNIFNYPNKIAESDFQGWVQERGTYFMDKWDNQYTALLSSHDPGEEPLNGGLLRAAYGKGTYIYCGYAFFRQLPAGVPGAVRLFVNIVSAGHGR